jgi:hypothetical protein
MTTPSVTLTLNLTVTNADGSTSVFTGTIPLTAFVAPEGVLPETLPFNL